MSGGGGYSFLIEGDNLHTLTLLEKTHTNKIDVIYIDPPYNIGNKAAIYNDSFIDKGDGYIHSKWLSFMSKRLEIAKRLLCEDGVIFISINDNEHAQLKLLCDNIFGEENFMTNLCVELSKTQGMKVKVAQKGKIVKNHEYVYVYCKNINKAGNNRQPLYDKTDIWDSHFNKIITKQNDRYTVYAISEYIQRHFADIYQLFERHHLLERHKITANSIRKGMLISTEIQQFFYEEISDIVYQEMACSITIPHNVDEALNDVAIVAYEKYLLTKTATGKLRQYRSLKETIKLSDDYIKQTGRVTIRGALWKGFYSDMMNVQKEGGVDFKNGKKPVRLIAQLNKWANRKNAVVLDFFAGSGTTGHAVMQLNKEDGGTRQYILCTNNENNICQDVTYQRLKNIQKDLPHNLKYLKADFISKYQNDEDNMISNKILRHVKELIELEHHIEIDNKKYIILDDENNLDAVINTIAETGSLFIVSGVLLSRTQQRLLNEKNITVISVPEYYHSSELKITGEL